MFYCNECGAKKGWPTNTPSRLDKGVRCEICKQEKDCNDVDCDTLAYYDKPLVLIVRGIQGAGKSTALEYWALDKIYTFTYHSADLFWLKGEKGEQYEFDITRMGEAHAWCYKRFLDSITAPFKYHVIDNTNIHTWEIAPYVLATNAYGLRHEIVTLYCDPKIAAARNVHGVPTTTVFQKHQELLQEKLPPHWNHRVVFDGKI